MNDCASTVIAEILPLLEKLAACGCPSRKKPKPIADILKVKADPATKIQDLGLSVISQDVLAQAKISTVGDVVTKLEPDLLATRRMTFRALADIEHALLGRPEKPSWEEVLQAIEKRNA